MHDQNGNRPALDELRRRQLQAMAENLCNSANRFRDDGKYAIASSLYHHAIATAERIVCNGDPNPVLERIRQNQAAMLKTQSMGK